MPKTPRIGTPRPIAKPQSALEVELKWFGVELTDEELERYRVWAKENPRGGLHGGGSNTIGKKIRD